MTAVIHSTCLVHATIYTQSVTKLSFHTVHDMLVFLILLLLALAAAWLLSGWMRTRKYWKQRGIPHQPTYPLIGSFTFLLRYNPAVWMRKVYAQGTEPYVGCWVFWRPALIINDPELARRILIKDAAVFRDRFASSRPADPIGHLNMFTAKGKQWSSVRRRLTAVFTNAKMKGPFDLMRTKSKEVLQRIDADMKSKQRIELRTMFTDFTTDVIAGSAFGLAGDATLTGKGTLRAVTKSFMEFNLFRGLAGLSIFFLPELIDVFGFTAFPKNTTDLFRQIFSTILQQRGGYETKIKENRDLFDALIKMKQESAGDNEEMSEDMLVAQAAIFLLAGFDTTGSILAFCAYELAFNQEVQDKLYKELIKQKEKIGYADFDVESLSELKYLDCIINETLRKYQPMGWLDRIALEDYKIDDHLTIEAGTPIYVNVMGIHYDPKYYPEPEKFNPDRFLDKQGDNTKGLIFVPFGEGPRSCIGRRFAMINLRKVLSTIFLNYEVRPLPGTRKPTDVVIDSRNLFLSPGEPLLVEFVKRTS
ncbi:cytochrome P450 6l1-like [Battus philenor]|uniref:cytochrome P450 6l1-like n=1 Tax=Battus philenor TaxID=42288 RepID=UPI0035D0D555